MSETPPVEYSKADLAFIYDGPKPTDAELGIARPTLPQRQDDGAGRKGDPRMNGRPN